LGEGPEKSQGNFHHTQYKGKNWHLWKTGLALAIKKNLKKGLLVSFGKR